MRLDILGCEVFFPYDYVYPEQLSYMVELKRGLDHGGQDGCKGHCVLEMPTGTGKTVSLLALILSYQITHPEAGKLVYCTRTVQEMDKVVEEVKRCIQYISEECDKDKKPRQQKLAVCLSSRRNMCIHPTVSQFDYRDKVDSLCRSFTASWVREQAAENKLEASELCQFYEGFDHDGSDVSLTGVYSLDDIKELGRKKTWCPYFTARHLINIANIVVFNYQYMIDPKISSLVSRELSHESIIVFDEAHNIDNVCIEALSVQLNKRTLFAGTQNVNSINRAVAEMERTDAARLREEYQRLVSGLANVDVNPAESSAGALHGGEDVQASPILSPDIIAECMPGNLRKAKHFVMFLRSLLEYLKTRLTSKAVTTETPLEFLQHLQSHTHFQDSKALRFCYARLNSLLRTLRITNLEEFTPIQLVADFFTLVSSYSKGFSVLFEPYDERNDPVLQLCCLDSSLAIRPLFERFRNVIITSGTLSPLDIYPKILNFSPTITESFPMSMARNCICPLIVAKGSDQVPISSKYDCRSDASVIQNYGRLLIELAQVVPDGIVCFFTSYLYLEEIVNSWSQMGLLKTISEYKLVFFETKDIVETTLALDNYRKACDCGRGAIFFSVARGKVAEGIDFDRHYGRCVIMFGIPFQYTLSNVLKGRLQYLKEVFQIQESEFLTFDAIRQTSQCVGRVIRSKTDYGLMILADVRYSRSDKRNKLPTWIKQFLDTAHLSLSTDRAIHVARQFLNSMAQPMDTADHIGFSLLDDAGARKSLARTFVSEQK